MRIAAIAWCACALAGAARTAGAQERTERVIVRLSWGHRAPDAAARVVKIVPRGVEIVGAAGRDLERGEALANDTVRGTAGKGDVDALDVTLAYPSRAIAPIKDLHIIWADLIARSDAATARRLTQDAAFRPDTRRLTVQLNEAGTSGFTITVDQLLTERALWIPAYDLFVSVGGAAGGAANGAAGDSVPTSFDEHQRQLAAAGGRRVLDALKAAPDATHAEYLARWDDMGDPAYQYHGQTPGHVVVLAWDSTLAKFEIDRGAGVWNDEAKLDPLRFWFEFGDLTEGIQRTWKSQRLTDGLPVIVTTFERDGVRYEVEQFAYPLHGVPRERRGDLTVVLTQRVTVTELTGRAREVPITFHHLRRLTGDVSSELTMREAGAAANGQAWTIAESGQGRVFAQIELPALPTGPTLPALPTGPTGPTGPTNANSADAPAQRIAWSGVRDYQRDLRRVNGTFTLPLAANGSARFVVKLPSPAAAPGEAATLSAIDYEAARAATLKFWGDYVARGAQFVVPEPVVNDLFRANLWHALRLPRRHSRSDAKAGDAKASDTNAGETSGTSGPEAPQPAIDLPYSNVVYRQTGTPWPVNQAVYVDYMLYGLRGYDAIAREELAVIYRNNQGANGHVGGYANWGVYTPSMLYTAGKNFLLSGDRVSFDAVLPASLKALDWCLAESRAAAKGSGPSHGLINAPLNDLTGGGVWAFNQAYLYAGFDLFGRALQRAGHPRAQEALEAARVLRGAIAEGFGAAAMRSPLVPLRDGTWTPYVPAEAATEGRLMKEWYPTDVDTGAGHLLRLKALPSAGVLADALLHDHEDNLFLHGWGIANEPVYNQHGLPYLMRDEPQAAIRTFYSLLASGFSQSVLEPVEHRWTHPQWFGPPSTDGAWFELYRHMLIHEQDDDTLLIGQAAPRAWLQDGKRIEVQRAPTFYGPLSFAIESRAAAGAIDVTLSLSPHAGAAAPSAILVRLRHPDGAPLHSVSVNGQPWTDFDPAKEWVRLPRPAPGTAGDVRYRLEARYARAVQ